MSIPDFDPIRDGPLMIPRDLAVRALDEKDREIGRLKAENEHLLTFVVQKCRKCGLVMAPDANREDRQVLLRALRRAAEDGMTE